MRGMYAGVPGAAADATTIDERGPGAGTGGPWAQPATGDFAGGGGGTQAAFRRLAHAGAEYFGCVHGASDGGAGLRSADFWFSYGDPGDSGTVAGEQSGCSSGIE